MPKYSVKKPFTVLVLVILTIVLGFVSITGMSTDLLPSISLPYLVVVAAYPGASPEKVESELTDVLESGLGTVNGVENITSTSSENYCMVMLEFAENTNMDSAMVKTSTALNQLAGSLPDGAGTPSLMEVSMDMMATQYVGVNVDGMDIYEISEYVSDRLIPEIERINGVADVRAVGLVQRGVEVELQQDLIDEVNDKLLVKVNAKLADAKKELDQARKKLESGKSQLRNAQAQLDAGQAQLDSQQSSMAAQLRQMIESFNEMIPGLESQIGELEGVLGNSQSQLENINSQLDSLKEQIAQTMQQLNLSASSTAQEVEPQAQALRTADDTVRENRAKITAMQEELDAVNLRLESEDLTEEERAELTQQASDLSAQTQALEAVNAQILAALEITGDEPEAQLSERRQLMDSAYEMLLTVEELSAQSEDVKKQIEKTTASLENLRNQLRDLNAQRAEMQSVLQNLEENPLDTGLGDMAAQLVLSGMNAQLAVGQLQIASGQAQLETGEEQLKAAEEQFETAREEALKSANLDQLLNMSTLSQILKAQNFSMPAGYISDGDHQILLKVGDAYESIDELGGTLLCTIDGIGDVRLSDVAKITVTDNSNDTYAKMDGEQMVLLSIYKSSTASTSDVSEACNKRAQELMEDNPDLHIVAIMDQGEYIRLIVSSVVSNLLWGALLAIIVLALFLKDLRPTLVVAISIPLSVMFAVVLMYFTGINLNIISLSGLALGIGMLVDNSVVVIENIYRLRARGIPAARASVQGARQVSGAIISSTLTTICVFAPLLFATGLVRQLLSDLGLTIAYSLLASLIVAMSVVPSAGSTLLRNQREIKHPWFDRVLELYDKALRWCLKHKVIPLAAAVGLFVFSVISLVNAGIVIMPEITGNQLTATVRMPEGTDQQSAFKTADDVLDVIVNVDGIQNVGVMTTDSLGGAMGMGTGSGKVDMNDYTFYMILTDEGGSQIDRITKEIMDKTAILDCTIEVTSSSSMDMSQLTGSGLEVDIRGQDLNTLLEISGQVEELLAEIEGVGTISNGQENGDNVVKILVNKDKAMRYNLTTAQIYMTIAQALSDETTSTTLRVGEDSYTVTIVDSSGVPTMDDLFEYEFEVTVTDDSGSQSKETHRLNEFASRLNEQGVASISHKNQTRTMTVNAQVQDGYNTTLLSRQLQSKMNDKTWPQGYTVEIGGETTQVNEMVVQMIKMMALALLMIYFVMVAQFQSLLSPFIVMFTIPLAFTGGMIALLIFGETLSMLSLMGFLILMGVIVNNGIVFVDYTNQLRIGGLERREALVATGKTRMRPILMTTLTTVLSMVVMISGNDMGSAMGKGMAIVVVGGLLYATLMTLFIVPIIYDILFKHPPLDVNVGDEGMDDLPDDAAEYMAQLSRAHSAYPDDSESDPFPDFPIQTRTGGQA